MTTPYHHDSRTDDSASPPPGCPAHALGAGGVRRIYGAEADADLPGVYEKLRAEHGAVAPALLHEDVPIWVVLGHSENLHMLRTPSQYTRDPRIWRANLDGSMTDTHPLAPVVSYVPMCSMAEGAEHQRLRGAVTDAMAHLDHRGVRRYINRYSNTLINEFCQNGTADLVARYAEHLPMAVMCELLGMPEEYNERMVQSARDMLKGTETAIASNQYIMEALGRLVARRRAKPEEDFTGRLVDHPSALTDDEVVAHLRLVLMAAYEATANLMANVLRMVFTDPRFRAQLSGGQMTVPEAIEQVLWDEPPFSAMIGYFAKQDTELGGQRIKAGDGLIMGIQPGNVDPVVRPDLAANMQGNRSHLAFSGGPHECPGQDIGRAIADTGVDALLMRLPDVQLSIDESELRWTSSIMSRHLVELPVTFEPRPQQDVGAPPATTPAAPRQNWQVDSPVRQQPAAAPPQAVPAQPTDSARTTQAPPPGVVVPAPRQGVWARLSQWWRGGY